MILNTNKYKSQKIEVNDFFTNCMINDFWQKMKKKLVGGAFNDENSSY